METKGVIFDQIVKRGCGIDVHKKVLVATINGEGIKEETRTFNAYTNSIEELKDWLKEFDITHIAMESTGVYWRPVFTVLEEDFEIILVNARHIKNVPGHKTDKKDSKWICKLLISGLLKGSFIPPKPIRDLRDLTRYRRKIKDQIASDKNRIHKVLETANIKLSSVLSDMSGSSATKIIEALIDGEEDIDKLLSYCHSKIKASKDEIRLALKGFLTPHHQFMLRTIRISIASKSSLIKTIDKEIDSHLEEYKLSMSVELLQSIPGVGKDGAIEIIAEIGNDMNPFPSEQHLASWAGMCPGNNESAGKKKVVRPLMEIFI
jgi:transposase